MLKLDAIIALLSITSFCFVPGTELQNLEERGIKVHRYYVYVDKLALLSWWCVGIRLEGRRTLATDQSEFKMSQENLKTEKRIIENLLSFYIQTSLLLCVLVLLFLFVVKMKKMKPSDLISFVLS